MAYYQTVMAKLLVFEETIDLECTRERLWPLVSDTDGINRALGLFSVAYEAKEEKTGGSVVTARATLFGMGMEWREYPFEWVEPEKYSVRRVFERGPVEEARGLFFFDDLGPRSRARVRVELVPRGLVGGLIAKVKGGQTARGFIGLFRKMDEAARNGAASPLDDVGRTPIQPESLQAALTKLRDNGVVPAMIDRLREWVARAPDRAVVRARPFALADDWKRPREEVLRAFLIGTRAGVFNMHWDIVCPQCRKAEDRLDSLARLPKEGH